MYIEFLKEMQRIIYKFLAAVACIYRNLKNKPIVYPKTPITQYFASKFY